MPASGSRSDATAYSAVFPTKGLADLQEETLKFAAILEADGDRASASVVRNAFFRLESELKDIARHIAALATEEIQRAEADSRVRPDTGGDGGKRLEDYLGESNPLDVVPGSVGVNFEPPLYQNVPWWWTNEEGYSGHIGRVVHGYFYDSGFTNPSAPSGAQFREHALFRAEGPQQESGFRLDDGEQYEKPGRGARPAMVIKNPIPERRFVREGVRVAEAEWHARVRAARSRFDATVDKVFATPVRPAPGRRRGR